MIFLALCLLYGIDINGKRTRKVNKVLYVDAEDDLNEFANRVTAIRAGLCKLFNKELPPVDPDRLVYMNVQMDTLERAAGCQLRQAIGEVGAEVVIYDALQSLFGGNQSSGEVGSEVWHWIQRTALESGHVPLAVDHCGWQGRHEQGSVQKRGRVGQSLQVEKRAGHERVLADGSEYQVIDVYLRKSNYQVGADNEAPVLSIACTFTSKPCLLEGDHEEHDCMGATLLEYVEAPPKSEDTVSRAVANLEVRGETTEVELAETLGKTPDALRKAITREQKRGNPEAKRLVSAKNPKRWSLRQSQAD
jgi:hypothetical protein